MATGLETDVLERIGGTPIIGLRNVVPDNGARLLLKLESENPTGSMKDRMALAMVEAVADEIDRVSTDEAVAMALRLAREEGLFGGTSPASTGRAGGAEPRARLIADHIRKRAGPWWSSRHSDGRRSRPRLGRRPGEVVGKTLRHFRIA